MIVYPLQFPAVPRRLAMLLAGVFAAGTASAALPIDLTKPAPAFTELHLNQGSNRDPQGHTLTADSQSLLLDGQPFVSVSGEFHFGRYPRAEWREELLKMKAGGCTTVSTYVFWIYHEEEQGHWDWTGQRSLREFIQTAQEVGLKVVLRCGPWAHGEARNGGFPDWVQNSHTKLRTNDPAFMALVRPYYQQIAEQTRGLYWKDGGRIFAVQVDNEIDNPEYLLALKSLAREVGIDAPFYIMTGWGGVRIPKQDLLPVFGAYAWAFWGKGEPGLASFVFGTGRNTKDMGAQPAPNAPAPSPGYAGTAAPATPTPAPTAAPPPVLDPYLTGELGGGMASSYVHRIVVAANDVAGVNLVRLGDGNTMPGFYMYQGGINPDGKLSFLNEAKPNPLPPKSYDFEAPLGAWGEVREHYHLLREQNLFVQYFGPELLRMRAYMPVHGAGVTDVEPVRWAVRWKDDAGFLLFCNYAPVLAFHDHPGTQFALQTPKGTEQVPAEPITIPANEYGVWPLHLDCHGAMLQYATAQPLCYSDVGKDRWYFFKTIHGIEPDFVFDRKGVHLTAGKEEASGAGTLRLRHFTPGAGEAFALGKEDGGAIHFVVLSADQSKTLWCAPFAGRDRVFLSNATVLADGGGLRLQAGAAADFSFAVFPPLPAVAANTGNFVRSMDGAFARFTPSALSDPKPVHVQIEPVHPAAAGPPELPGTDDNAWKNAAVWKVSIPPEAAGRHLLVQVHYLADAARLYAGSAFLDDNYYNSRPFDFGLWRIPQAQWADLTLKILPYTPALLDRLPDAVRQKVAAMDPAEQSKVTATVVEQVELKVMPAATQ